MAASGPSGHVLARGGGAGRRALDRAWAAATRACCCSADGRLLAHVLDRLRPQVGGMAISANGDPARFAAFGLPVLADTVEGYLGPLAGLLAGMQWAKDSARRRSSACRPIRRSFPMTLSHGSWQPAAIPEPPCPRRVWRPAPSGRRPLAGRARRAVCAISCCRRDLQGLGLRRRLRCASPSTSR